MNKCHHRLWLSAAIVGTLIVLSGAGSTAIADQTVAPVEVRKAPPVARRAAARHIRRVAMPRVQDCSITWCEPPPFLHPFILFIGIGF